MASLIGKQIGNYQVMQIVGEGGHAKVYLCHHIQKKNQLVAIKAIIPCVGEEHEALKAEAQRLFQLKHPHIIPLLDVLIEDENIYLIMEYAPNGTLRSRHTSGSQLELPTVVSYTEQIASALQYIHNNKLVHRDVKPANVLIGLHNELLLSDIGIAVVAHSEASLVTQNLAGTPEYMAPEQCIGRPFPASDQYALAIMAYEWLCGIHPFTSGNMLFMHVFGTIPLLRTKRANIPESVELVIMRALEKEPSKRFPSVMEFAEALKEASLSTLPGNRMLPISHVPNLSQGNAFVLVPQLFLPESLSESKTFVRSAQSHRWLTTNPFQKYFTEALAPAQLYKAGLIASEQGDIARTLQSWLPIIEIDLKFLDGIFIPRLVETLRRFAEQAKQYRDWSMAAQAFRKLRLIYPDNVGYKQSLIQCLRSEAEMAHREGTQEQEFEAWEELLRLLPKDKQALQGIIDCLCSRANEMSRVGNLEQEIRIWENILRIKPGHVQARRRLTLARKHKTLVHSYEMAHTLITKGELSAARAELRLLQKDAPYYGDPAGLMQYIKLDEPLKWPTDFDKEETQRRATKMPATSRFVRDILSTNYIMVYVSIFYLLAGVDVTCALLTRSWLWALVATIFTAILAHLLGYRRTMHFIAMSFMTALISASTIYTVYNIPLLSDTSHLTWFWNGPVSIGKQINLGLLFGLSVGITCCIGSSRNAFSTAALRSKGIFILPLFTLLIGAVVWFPTSWITAVLLKQGAGWGYGWYFGLITWIAIMVGGTGLGNSLYIWVQAFRHPQQ